MTAPGLGSAVAAELDKLRTLPAMLLAVLGTVLAGAALGSAFAASAVAARVAFTATDATLATVPYLQAGMLVVGALPFTHEYAGSQIRSTLAAMPQRPRLLVAKTLSTLMAIGLTAVGTVAATWAAGAITSRAHGVREGDVVLGSLAGAAGYLLLMGLLASGIALLVRHLVPTLVTLLSVVMIASPLLAAQSEHARWLPDRAAQQLYAATDAVLTPGTGSLIALTWVVAIGGVAALRFVRRDA
ncbi:hypothetical protein [Micropruina sp.]|uniref:hypothetical protein n=1 Tax=Micropruina sp. TaxID=2737536 RepID=UPI0039E6C88E